MRRNTAAGAMVLLVLMLLGCRTNMASSEAGDPGSSRRVLIAGEQTDFKSHVVEAMIAKLGTKQWYFRIIGLDQLAQQDTGQYGAILLLAGYRAGRIDERVASFLEKDPTDPKIVVFYTRGTEDPMPERSKPDLRVDAISSASKKDREELRAGELAELIEKRF
jgi:hypothetical protein